MEAKDTVLTAHQSKYLPWLGLFHKIALATHYVAFDQVQYQKREFLNRNSVKAPDGKAVRLTVPVQTAGRFDQRIDDTLIDNRTPWTRKHWRTMCMCYGKAPYFAPYAPFFEDLYQRRWERLVDLNRRLTQFLLEALGIEVAYLQAADYDFTGQGSDLVLDMCLTLGAGTYIFGEGGHDYADEEAFGRAGVQLVFQEYRHPVYPQLHGPFVPGLSVVDLLFNCGPESLETLFMGNMQPLGLRV